MRNDRLYQLKDLLLSRPGIGMQDLIHELEVTKATVKRDIEALRDRFDTPIVYDRFHGGYFIHTVQEDTSRRAVKRSELPGLWFREGLNNSPSSELFGRCFLNCGISQEITNNF